MKYFSVAVEMGSSFCGTCVLPFSVLLSVWVAVLVDGVPLPLIGLILLLIGKNGKDRLILLLIGKNDLPSQS